jgi:CDP-glucose 4,6-dehydratase
MDNFWENKKVFLTGHTGFKGSWLTLCLDHLGANISGFALEPITSPAMYEQLEIDRIIDSTIADIRDAKVLENALLQASPQIIFHLAAQPLVRESYDTPIETYTTNVIGTANLLNAARKLPDLKAIIIVTSDKCYFNYESEHGYKEDDKLGGFDPYSSSKACTEILTDSFRNSFFNPEKYNDHGVAIATARSGNVIGGGDWSIDRLVPDTIRAIQTKEILNVRFPNSTRPWQHVLDPLNGYLMLAKALTKYGANFGEAFNFGPNDPNNHRVVDVLNIFKDYWINDFDWITDQKNHHHEASLLHLDCMKAKTKLNWQPLLDFKQSLELTARWYQTYLTDKDVISLTKKQIQDFF